MIPIFDLSPVSGRVDTISSLTNRTRRAFFGALKLTKSLEAHLALGTHMSTAQPALTFVRRRWVTRALETKQPFGTSAFCAGELLALDRTKPPLTKVAGATVIIVFTRLAEPT